MNKFARKAAAVLFAGAMVAQMGIGASAIDININGQGVGASYRAFRLLNLNTSLKADGHDGHPDGEHTDACYNYAYTVNEKYRSYLRTAMGNASATDQAIVDYIRGLDANGAREFADALYEAMYPDVSSNSLAADGVATAEDGGTTATVTTNRQGYYLISEATIGTAPDSKSLVMLDTLGQEAITVNTKEDIPTLTKKILENGTPVDAIDLAATDEVEFELTGTMPDNISSYDTYYYEFHDTIADGLKIKADSFSVTVDGATATVGTADTNNFVYDGGTDTFSVKTSDLKAVATGLGKTLTADSKVIVKYKAVVDATAESGTVGNVNTAKLEFSNNPYDQGVGKTSNTPDDKVKVFTYDVIVNKKDGTGAALKGANFTLQKKGADGTYSDYRTNTFNADQTVFEFRALDAGEYQLVESTVPDGYNGAEPVKFEIRATYDKDSADPQLTDLKVFIDGAEQGADGPFTINMTPGEITTSVVNSTGTKLPSTGGSGTYAFYIGGGVLVAAGAGTMIMMRKRKKSAE